MNLQKKKKQQSQGSALEDKPANKYEDKTKKFSKSLVNTFKSL